MHSADDYSFTIAGKVLREAYGGRLSGHLREAKTLLKA